MIVQTISAFFCLLSTLSFGFYNSKKTMIKEIVNDMPLSVIQNSVIFIDNFENINYSFDKANLEKSVKNYLSTNLKDKVKSYKISFLYYFVSEDKNIKIDLTEQPKNVQIHFKCEIISFITYEDKFSYSVNEKEIDI